MARMGPAPALTFLVAVRAIDYSPYQAGSRLSVRADGTVVKGAIDGRIY